MNTTTGHTIPAVVVVLLSTLAARDAYDHRVPNDTHTHTMDCSTQGPRQARRVGSHAPARANPTQTQPKPPE
ncbi:hypothetical protein E2C01_086281 [Portunus trituberculatus]|uniref:Secreted protein n=1 Tax=Portunus trituberculatus TaxID=210409 RepID=A0A5B7JD12_PORTR|nr:hypothetical protein [Portunus trituberculatus]